MSLVVGIFVGGRGRRMGGVAKGLLRAPDSPQTLVERLVSELALAMPAAEVVLVGNAAPYSAFGLRAVADEPRDIGPLGGLLGLLAHAEQRAAMYALTLACDLPRVDHIVLSRLATDSLQASALVTELDGVRNPLLARYRVAAALPAARAVLASGARSLQAVLDLLQPAVSTLPMTDAERATLHDWDFPEDVG